MTERCIIRNGLVVDPSRGLQAQLDLAIVDGRIEQVGNRLPPGGQEIDATGKQVWPGVIDMHVHLREPGGEGKETVATGTRAAAMGGVTAVVPMPNTSPPVDTQAGLKLIASLALHDAVVRVFPAACATLGRQGVELSEHGDLKANGAVALSDDGDPIKNGAVMRRVLEYSSMFDLPVLSHCEDPDMTTGGCMNEGLCAAILGLAGMNHVAEEVMIARDIMLAEITGGRLHIQHVSTRGGVELVRQGKARGIKVTAEATPHHFTLTEQACMGYDTRTKMNPPLRTEADRQAVIAGLADGTIDIIASDHAPHTLFEKEREFMDAPFGIIGLETLIPLTCTELVAPGRLTLSQAVAALSTTPAKLLGLELGTLQEGRPADITIVDPDLEHTYVKAEVVSKSRNSPFFGRTMKGWPVLTMVAGRIVMQDRRLCL